MGPSATAVRSAMACAVALSAAGSVNASVLTGARVIFAAARDKRFPKVLGVLNQKFRTPVNALIAQSVWGTVLLALPFSDFHALVGYFGAVSKLRALTRGNVGVDAHRAAWSCAAPVACVAAALQCSWVYYGATAAALVMLRRKQPELHRPYRVAFYPATPFLVMLIAAVLVLSSLVGAAAGRLVLRRWLARLTPLCSAVERPVAHARGALLHRCLVPGLLVRVPRRGPQGRRIQRPRRPWRRRRRRRQSRVRSAGGFGLAGVCREGLCA